MNQLQNLLLLDIIILSNNNMKLTTIYDLFTAILLRSKRERQKDKHFDGLNFWRGLKPILSNSKYQADKWKNISVAHYENTMAIPEYYIDGHGKTIIIEENHFLIQLVRIPKTEIPSLQKIMQIALNIGQYLGYTRKNTIKKSNIKDYVSAKESNTKLLDILTQSDIDILESKLS